MTHCINQRLSKGAISLIVADQHAGIPNGISNGPICLTVTN